MLKILSLNGISIYQQLLIEEALLRADDSNWCIINSGASDAIVLGISAKPEEVIDIERWEKNPVPVIKRFSGGGTVYIDPNTFFVTFICNEEFAGIPSYPHNILKWTENLYRQLLDGHDFHIQENDYILGNKKFGGNAQYIRKKRWLHHSSLLWDFHPSKMDTLLIPPRMPSYRQGRPHHEFIRSLRDVFPTCENLRHQLLEVIQNTFPTKQLFPEDLTNILTRPHRRTTKILTPTSSLNL